MFVSNACTWSFQIPRVFCSCVVCSDVAEMSPDETEMKPIYDRIVCLDTLLPRLTTYLTFKNLKDLDP